MHAPTSATNSHRAARLAWLLLLICLATATTYRVTHLPADQPHAIVATNYRINVNQADVSTLQLLPGLGPSLAQGVVEYRQANGPFQTSADLEAVRMIGPVLRQRIEPWITLGTTPKKLAPETDQNSNDIPTPEINREPDGRGSSSLGVAPRAGDAPRADRRRGAVRLPGRWPPLV